ncbi:MAG TPA: carboxypeptidase-like regulatory domain-containing protein, partial [Dongiaceae bacterium]|nr:carboxypeptidase-like regulatory domain-containing protein [Dongiaceae bacterium]
GTLALGPGFQGGTITNLTLAGMKLSGTNTVSGTFNCGGGALGGLWVAEGAVMNWSGGTVAGPLTVADGGVLNLGGTLVSLGDTLTNAGTVNWTSGTVAVCCAGPIVNLAGALWDIQCDQTLYETCCVSSNFQFLNAGTVRKSAGSGTTYLQIPFYNTGSLSLLNGSVSFNLANTYAQAGATLDFGLAGTGRAAPLVVNGDLSLDGTRTASLLDNYRPFPGDTIPLISCGALTHSFTSLNLPPIAVGNNLDWHIVYAANAVSLQVVSNGNTTAQIAGMVMDTTGAPVANLTVFAFTTNSSNSLFLSAATDGSGHYGLNVANGLWLVGLQGLAARGYNDVPTQDVVVNDASQTLNFVLLVQPVTRPALSCTLAASQLLFSWPASLSGVELRITGNLADPNSWRTVPVVPVQAGAEMQVTAPLVPGNHFYRLFRP